MTVPNGGALPPIDDDTLSAYLDGDLSLPEQETVRRAIQTDATVRERYRELAATVSLIRALPPPALPRSFILTSDQVRGLQDPGSVPLAAAPAANVVRTFAPQPHISRFTPLFGAFGAIAAVLLLVLVTADFATGGFRAATPVPQRTSSAAIEQVTATTTSVAVTGARSNSPAFGAAQTTTGASVRPAQPAPASGAVRSSDTTSAGVPLAFIRAVEVALGIVAVGGIVLAVQGARARPRHMAHG